MLMNEIDADQGQRDIFRKAYLTIAGVHAYLMRNNCNPEELDLLNRWLDEYIDYY